MRKGGNAVDLRLLWRRDFAKNSFMAQIVKDVEQLINV